MVAYINAIFEVKRGMGEKGLWMIGERRKQSGGTEKGVCLLVFCAARPEPCCPKSGSGKRGATDERPGGAAGGAQTAQESGEGERRGNCKAGADKAAVWAGGVR